MDLLKNPYQISWLWSTENNQIAGRAGFVWGYVSSQDLERQNEPLGYHIKSSWSFRLLFRAMLSREAIFPILFPSLFLDTVRI
jgi:hypothetical protein